jgi:erythritol transport system ATP-binding protein
MTSVAAPVLIAQGIAKRYGATSALAGVDFAVEPGRVHALIGENGAGKSTLVKILAGVEQPTSGELRFQGERVQFASPRDAGRLGIDIIHQELQLFPELSIEENLFAGRERVTRWGTIDRAAQRTAATEVLGRLGLRLAVDRRVGSLPLGQQQIVEIARAIVHDTRVLMMDEPTSALTAAEIPVLFGLIRDLTAHGVGIVYISHRLEELLAIADMVTVLRDGAIVGHAARADVSVQWIVQRMTGRDAPPAATHAGVSSREPILAVKDLELPAGHGRTGLRGVTFEVRPGEILGLYGLMGAGRTELLESVLGVHDDARGSVRLDGQELSGLDVRERIEEGIAMVPEDRQTSGLVQTMTVQQNMTLAHLGALTRGGYLSLAREARAASEWGSRLRVKAPALDAPIGALSGGNQQKVVIARSVMTSPRVLLMDEPTRGVDVGAKREIVDTMRRLAADGMAVVFATSELAEMHAAADRALVMARGCIAAEFSGHEMTDEAMASAASAPPPLSSFSEVSPERTARRRTDG